MLLGSTVLEVAIGLALLYALLSLVLTSARELIEALLQTRAINLERGIRELLDEKDGTDLAKQLYDHPYISSLFRGTYDPAKSLRWPGLLTRAWTWVWGSHDPWKRLKFNSNLPAYIPARNFAVALLDTAARGAPGAYDAIDDPMTFETLKAGVARTPNLAVRRALLLALEDARGDIDRARQNVEQWFDAGMDRVSGRYRKQTQWILLVLGLITAVALNVDTLRIASALYHDDALRAVAVKQAERIGDHFDPADPAKSAQALGCTPVSNAASASERAQASASCAKNQIDALGYPMGWTEPRFDWRAIPGWLITALALSLGAPFWFDLLSKMMIVRSTVKPHQKSPEEPSQARQKAAPPPAPPAGGGGEAGAGAPVQPSAASGQASAASGTTARSDWLEEDPLFEPRQWRESDPQEGAL